MPKPKKKPVRPPLEFINEPFSKPKGETVYKTCSEVYPEVKRAPIDEVNGWFEPSFRTLRVPKKQTVARSSSNPRHVLPELEFVDDERISVKSLSTLDRQKSCPLFPLKSPEAVSRNVVVLVKETPENTNRTSKSCAKGIFKVRPLFEELPGCTEDLSRLKIRE
ncbi:unnamed protein product [Heterobilharzia americana]|nr:unnamed protein product [Heterobilharzia americana]